MKKLLTSMRVDSSPEGEVRDGLSQSLFSFFYKMGYQLIPVPNQPSLVPLVLKAVHSDGILLSGGNDLDPKLYSGNVLSSKNISVERDQTEKRLLEFAIHNQKPVLGICRGFQMINIFFGGRLLQNIADEIPGARNHVATPHPIQWLPNGTAKFFDKFESIVVNSFHQQGFTQKEISSDLEILAISSDRIIEAAKHKRWPILGIMWHPERRGSNIELDQAAVRYLFEELP